MAVPSPRLSWYRSFYWRIGITFVAFVVVILITQGLILSQIISSDDAQDQFRAPVLAAEVAADVASVLRRGIRGADLGAHLKSRYPPERAGRFVFVAMRDGPMFSSTAEASAREHPAHGAVGVRRAAPRVSRRRASDHHRPRARRRSIRRSRAGVGAGHRGRAGIPRELGRLLSLPSTLVLMVAAVVVAMVVFNPARRRLAALEHAAQRLGEGDLSCESAADGW